MRAVIGRRRWVVSLGACALGRPFGAIAQPPAKPLRVGFLAFPSRPPVIDANDFDGFPRGLRELGCVEGGNLTLERLPRLSWLAVRVDGKSAPQSGAGARLQAAGRTRQLAIIRTVAATAQEIDAAFALAARERAGALMVSFRPLFNPRRRQIAERAQRHRLPTIAGDRGFVEAGCLMSYGASLTDDCRSVAGDGDTIADGALPGELPIEQPTRFDWVVNRKTARLLGLAVPRPLLLQADEVIE